MKKSLITTLVVIATTLFGYFARTPIMTALGFDSAKSFSLLGITAYRLVWNVVVPALAIALIHGPRQVWSELGWNANLLKGISVGALITLPMLLMFAIAFKPVNLPVSELWAGFYTKSFWAGLAEETVFRAFLFGQLYRHGRWPFWLAAGAQGIIFSIGHLYQAHDTLQAIGVFAVTFAGAVWFSWLWLCWKNLWVPITVHILMNAWWGLFAVDNSALGGWVANGCRAATIALSIWLTIRELQKQGRSAKIWQEKPASQPDPIGLQVVGIS